MKVLLAGGTGTLGVPVLKSLRAHDHEVLAIVRSRDGEARVRDLGATPVIADVMHRDSLLRALDGVRADAVIHELTALKKTPVRHADMTATNTLRIQGTTHLLDAARAIGATRFLTQSIVFGYGYYDHGDTILTEDSPFGQSRGDAFDPHLHAMLSSEQQIFEADGIEGISLRYGLLYGEDIDKVVGMLRRRSLPVPKTGGLLPFIHHRDAAAATVAALTLGRPGSAYNIVDDEPATFRHLLTAMADARHAPRPLTLPGWLLRAVAPYGGVVLDRVSMRVSSAKARSELNWKPAYPTYRDGVSAAPELSGRS
ncbi:MAG TPA: NAD(P)-dependent oxidoreductase [Microbacteriaceae bacterium]|jgi:Nucleoside-diphosphate-sugar epimerases